MELIWLSKRAQCLKQALVGCADDCVPACEDRINRSDTIAHPIAAVAETLLLVVLTADPARLDSIDRLVEQAKLRIQPEQLLEIVRVERLTQPSYEPFIAYLPLSGAAYAHAS